MLLVIIIAIILYILSIFFFYKYKKIRQIKKNSIEVMATVIDETVKDKYRLNDSWYIVYKMKVEYEINGQKRETYIQRTEAENYYFWKSDKQHKSHIGEKEILYVNDDVNEIVDIETTSMYFGLGTVCAMLGTAAIALIFILNDFF